MTRQAILPLVFAFLLKGFGNLNLIWGAFVLAELCGIRLQQLSGNGKGKADSVLSIEKKNKKAVLCERQPFLHTIR